MKLHWSPKSPYVRKVMVVAHEHGLLPQITLVRSVAAMLRPNAALMRDNPLSKIPTLVLPDGQRLSGINVNDARSGQSVVASVRPERIALDHGGANRIEAPLADAAFQGARVQLHFQAPPDGQILVETPSLPAAAGPGTSLKMSWAIDDTLVYPAPVEAA